MRMIKPMQTASWPMPYLHVAAGALLLSFAALAYGHAFIFHDSGTYYLYGEHIFSELSAAVRRNPTIVIPLGQPVEDYVGARSPTYGAFFYIATHKASLWGLVAIQALIASWVLFSLSKAVNKSRAAFCYWVTTTVLVFASSMSYFISYAMPDVFAGIGVLCVVALVLYRNAVSRVEYAATWLTLAVSTSFHPTFLIVFGAAAVAGLLAGIFLRVISGRQAVSIGGAVVAALAIGSLVAPAYRIVERGIFKHPINAPPFATARVLADGTGVAYRSEVCVDPSRFAICRIHLKFPVNSDAFLWGSLEEGGGYKAVDAATRSALRAEEGEFVFNSIIARPADQFRASLLNWANQIVLVDVFEPLLDPKTQASFSLFEQRHSRPGRTSQFAGEQTLQVARRVGLWVALIGLIAIATRSVSSTVSRQSHPNTLVFMSIIWMSVIINAGICGVISEPLARYQARIIWLLPASLVLIIFQPVVLAEITNFLMPKRLKQLKGTPV
jgi:hypothetical protein